MVKNTACLITTSCCVFKCTIFNHATTVFNSQSRSKGMFKIIEITDPSKHSPWWRRLDQDQYVPLSFTSSEDLFKTSSRRLGQTNTFVLAIRLQDVFKTFSRRLQNVSQKRLQNIFNRGICPCNTTSDNFMVSVQKLQDR